MTEIFKPVPGFEGFYEVSNHGNVRSVERIDIRGHKIPGKVLKYQATTEGYLRTKLHRDRIRKVFLVHRLVLFAFLGKNDLQCNHKDGNVKNNHIENLEYCTGSENILHSYRVLGKYNRRTKKL